MDIEEEEEILGELEEDIEQVENDFEAVKDKNAPETQRERQEMAEEILGEVHEQLNFLKEVVEKQNE